MTTFAPKQILIVEDEPKLAQLLKDYLTQADFTTAWLDNGLEVVPWIETHSTDLVLLDLMLPGRNGMDVCKAIRSFSTVPIIMIPHKWKKLIGCWVWKLARMIIFVSPTAQGKWWRGSRRCFGE